LEQTSTDFRLPDPISEETFRASIAALIGKPVNEVTNEQVVQIREKIEANAIKSADAVITHFDALYAHLHALGLRNYEECAAYLRFERETLASLYALVSKSNPSPTEVMRLVLRYCFDARNEVQGSLNRFILQRTQEGWLIEEYMSAAHTAVPFPAKRHQVTDPYAVHILDAVHAATPRLYRIMQIIESKFGGPPPLGETLAESTNWLTLADAERISLINRGVISRAVDAGELKSNGLSGKGQRKVDPADFIRWLLERAKKTEQTESTAQVERKVRNHVTD
jgi:hypothetical protein